MLACDKKMRLTVKTKRSGLTLIEMITVLAVIMILVGLLVPAVNKVRKMAKETQQRSQIATVSLGLEAWNDEFGYYPDSNEYTTGTAKEAIYTGAQKLGEALVGRDLRGFHPSQDLSNATGDYTVKEAEDYYLVKGGYTDDKIEENLKQRLDPFIDIDTARAYRGSEDDPTIFEMPNVVESVVICDVFNRFSMTLTSGSGNTTVVQAGMPLLYFRANPSGTLSEVSDFYDFKDNYAIIATAQEAAGLTGGFLEEPLDDARADDFYEFIENPAVTGSGQAPYRADSYILISAGYDGIYGTNDDITNFN